MLPSESKNGIRSRVIEDSGVAQAIHIHSFKGCTVFLLLVFYHDSTFPYYTPINDNNRVDSVYQK